jgi:YD repeat-containing protein
MIARTPGVGLNCRGCGTELEPSPSEVDQAVDAVLQASVEDAVKTGGVCPLCGHCKQVPYTHRPPAVFLLLAFCAVALAATLVFQFVTSRTDRLGAANEALRRANQSRAATSILGAPLVRSGNITGDVKHDETGWTEADLTIDIRGPRGDGQLHVAGGRSTGEWNFTTAEIMAIPQHKKIDLISGRVVEYDPRAYSEVHTQQAAVPEYSQRYAAETAVPPAWDGRYPCVVASSTASPSIEKCMMAGTSKEPAERFEVDLRYGNFILRETDLSLDDVFSVPLTRTFNNDDWIASSNPMHAFGMHANHPFDMAPLGKRNPYTEIYVVLADGSFVYFPRISKGTGYADAVYLHTETSTSFYKSIFQWNGGGWTLTKADGSVLHFPESYLAKNLAQGALTDMFDPAGNKLELQRDRRRNLQEIRTPHGKFIRFTYDDLDRITRAEDDRGNWATYRYTTDGYLSDVIRSDRHERHFTYENGQMTSIRDESGRTLVRNYYESWEVVRQVFGDGQEFSYEYHRTGRNHYADSVDVTGPKGKVTVSTAGTIPPVLLQESR